MCYSRMPILRRICGAGTSRTAAYHDAPAMARRVGDTARTDRLGGSIGRNKFELAQEGSQDGCHLHVRKGGADTPMYAAAERYHA
ncbi:hypothetical protein MSHO_02250 [Mycobacterium shottsii]|uniref:Uncharacterized protein n=1 Tax=Mycobacterium shottsii TaxID=133549 RepID=A0A7I7L5F6_9MYCO|nr:hypothetical protein MSHO_02250 [Mycobacterium shottsii]